MANSTTCSICLCRIKFYEKKRKLRCSHTFHENCIASVIANHKSNCPNCTEYIFTDTESKLLNAKSLFDMISFSHQYDLENVSPSPSNPSSVGMTEIMKEAVKLKRYELVSFLVDKYDPSNLVVEYILEGNVEGFKKLAYSKKINWHNSFKGGESFIDIALRCRNNEIINYILDRTGSRYELCSRQAGPIVSSSATFGGGYRSTSSSSKGNNNNDDDVYKYSSLYPSISSAIATADTEPVLKYDQLYPQLRL